MFGVEDPIAWNAFQIIKQLGDLGVMGIRAYQFIVGGLICVVLFLAWRLLMAERQAMTAASIDFQCETTQQMFIAEHSDPDPVALAMRLEFLVGYYEGYSRTLTGTPLAKVVERSYRQTLTNAVHAFRSWNTNDLGSDPQVWIKQYVER